MKKKYLVTGASGFIGSCLVRRLIEENNDVSIVVRKESDIWRIKDMKNNIKINNTDLANQAQVKEMVKNNSFDIVFHLATYGGIYYQKDVESTLNTNILGTWNLVKYCSDKGVEMFVNTSSSSEYGEKSVAMNEDMLLEPNNMYGASKASSTILCSTYTKMKKIPFITYRLFSPYGFFDTPTRLIPSMIISCLKNEPIDLQSKGAKRDFIFINDVIDAYINSTKLKENYGEVYNIGSGNQYSVEEVVNKIIKITNSKIEVNWNKNNDQRQYEPQVWYSNIDKIKNHLNWSPKTSIDNGLIKTIEWFIENKKLYEK